jgi:hypothetical protein
MSLEAQVGHCSRGLTILIRKATLLLYSRTLFFLRPSLNGTTGIWYEALTLLGEQKVVNSLNPDANAGWVDLLKAVQLESLAQEPIVRLYGSEL